MGRSWDCFQYTVVESCLQMNIKLLFVILPACGFSHIDISVFRKIHALYYFQFTFNLTILQCKVISSSILYEVVLYTEALWFEMSISLTQDDFIISGYLMNMSNDVYHQSLSTFSAIQSWRLYESSRWITTHYLDTIPKYLKK